jgi:hypothetical protein
MTLRERIPSVLPILRENSIIGVIVDAIEAEFERLGNDTDAVRDSLFIPTASGQSLDLIGEELGPIGQRAERSDEQYRAFLQGVVPIFNGRGTEQDVEIAIAAGVTRNPADVDLDQDFSAREYQVELSDWIPHQSSTTRELAELADPPAVDRVEPVQLLSETATVTVAVRDTKIGNATVSTTVTIQVSETDTQTDLVATGLSSDRLEPLSTVGFRLSKENI